MRRWLRNARWCAGFFTTALTLAWVTELSSSSTRPIPCRPGRQRLAGPALGGALSSWRDWSIPHADPLTGRTTHRGFASREIAGARRPFAGSGGVIRYPVPAPSCRVEATQPASFADSRNCLQNCCMFAVPCKQDRSLCPTQDTGPERRSSHRPRPPQPESARRPGFGGRRWRDRPQH